MAVGLHTITATNQNTILEDEWIRSPLRCILFELREGHGQLLAMTSFELD